MNSLMIKKKLFSSENKWWLAGSLSPSDVYCAFRFTGVPNEQMALTDLSNANRVLTKEGSHGNDYDYRPTWSSSKGFTFQSHNQNYHAGLNNAELNNNRSSIKSVFAAYSNLDGGNGCAILASFGNGAYKLYANAAVRNPDSGVKQIFYFCSPGFSNSVTGKVCHSNLSITGINSASFAQDGAVHTAKDKSYRKTAAVVGYTRGSSSAKFFVDGMDTTFQNFEFSYATGSNPMTFGNNTTNGTDPSIHWDGYQLKAVVAYKRELTNTQAMIISSTLQAFM